jgi:hypothetical protein
MASFRSDSGNSRPRACPWGAVVVWLAACAAQPAAAEYPASTGRLSGRVRSVEGKPVAGAVVAIVDSTPLRAAGGGDRDSHAARPAAAWCGPDCGKHTVTAEDGSFVMEGLMPNVRWTLRAEARGLDALTLPGGPLTTPVLFALQPQVVDDREKYAISGIVLAPDGSRAAGAVVAVHGFEGMAGAQAGKVAAIQGRIAFSYNVADKQGPDYQAQVTTDNEGHFRLRGSSAWRGVVVVSVSTGKNVRSQLYRLKPGTENNELQVVDGARIMGRVLYKSTGLAGVVVAATPFVPTNPRLAVNPASVMWMPTEQSVTDDEGRFSIEHVEPHRVYCLFVPMQSLAERGLSAISQEVHTPGDGQTVVTGELNLHPAHEVSGRVEFSGGFPLRVTSISVVLERRAARDLQTARLDAGGRFTFRGVPTESVVLSFHEANASSVTGFRLSPWNRSLEPVRRNVLCGRVDEDRELLVMFEPGAANAYTPGEPFIIATRRNPNGTITVDAAAQNKALMGVSPVLGRHP